MPRPSNARRLVRARVGLGLWSAVVVAATVPWTDFVGHTHWGKVQWVPFSSPPVKPADVVVNILLYVPLGFGLVRATSPRVGVWHAAAIAGALSLAIEWSQLYSHSRFPSLQDVLCNISGAWLGARWALAGRAPAA